jgi:adenylyl cyclase-associated protein
MNAVFSDLNKGENVTSGLRKVDKSEMTHKNPSLRGTAPVPAAEESLKPGRPSVPKKPASFQKKPPRCDLEGNKWTVENYDGNREIVIADTEISHTINIFSCKNSVIQIKGKVNAISMGKCVAQQFDRIIDRPCSLV